MPQRFAQQGFVAPATAPHRAVFWLSGSNILLMAGVGGDAPAEDGRRAQREDSVSEQGLEALANTGRLLPTQSECGTPSAATIAGSAPSTLSGGNSGRGAGLFQQVWLHGREACLCLRTKRTLFM